MEKMDKGERERGGSYLGRPARERIFYLDECGDYKGSLFPEGTHTVQEILFEDGNVKMAQIIRATGTRERNGGKEEYITLAVVNKESDVVDLEIELGLKPAP
jgi:hypothetical protein